MFQSPSLGKIYLKCTFKLWKYWRGGAYYLYCSPPPGGDIFGINFRDLSIFPSFIFAPQISTQFSQCVSSVYVFKHWKDFSNLLRTFSTNLLPRKDESSSVIICLLMNALMKISRWMSWPWHLCISSSPLASWSENKGQVAPPDMWSFKFYLQRNICRWQTVIPVMVQRNV